MNNPSRSIFHFKILMCSFTSVSSFEVLIFLVRISQSEESNNLFHSFDNLLLRMVLTTVVLRQSHCTQHLSRFKSYWPHTCPKPCFILPCRCSRSIKHSPLSAPCSPSLLPLETSMASTRWTCKLDLVTFSPNQAGNVVLSPKLLKGHQDFAKEQLKCSEEKPLYLVMHGGSGSSAAEIGEAVGRQLIHWEWLLHMTFIR